LLGSHLCPSENQLLTHNKDTISSLTNEFGGDPVTKMTAAVAAVNYASTDSNHVTHLWQMMLLVWRVKMDQQSIMTGEVGC
jgi:hypothetical protein